MTDLDAATTAAAACLRDEVPRLVDECTAPVQTAARLDEIFTIVADRLVAAARPLIVAEATARERQRIRQLAITEAKRQPLGGTFDSTEKVLLAFADLLDGDDDA